MGGAALVFGGGGGGALVFGSGAERGSAVAFSADAGASSASICTIANSPSSSMSAVPCSLAFLILEGPQSMPTSTYDVRPDTEPVTLPPCLLTKSSASSRSKESRMPVITKVTPSRQSEGPRGGAGFACLFAGSALESFAAHGPVDSSTENLSSDSGLG